MTDNEDRSSSQGADTSQPCWDGFSDRTASEKDSASNQSARPLGAKKPYRKPAYRFERVFETMALSCGKVGPVEFQCRFNRKNS